ncbi:MAG: hypothetical protein HXY22_04760 [Alphaproteobacteria bacterium]|nr:hypothetical protein [Alphaproteobacteria bacterium]
MRVRTINARTMPEAMARLREELGDDAIIISSESSRRGIILRAAIDDSAAPAKPGAAPALEDELALRLLRRLREDAGKSTLDGREIEARLSFHGLAEPLRTAVMTAALGSGAETPLEALGRALDQHFSFKPLPIVPRRPLMLVGLPGSGKTVTAAKLAARARLAGEAARLITCDTERTGGIGQLEAFSRILEAPLSIAAKPEMLKKAAYPTDAGKPALTIIDTPGTNPFDIGEMRTLGGFVKAAGAEIALVLPAGLGSEDAIDITRAFAALGAGKIIVTKVDAARRLGSLLAAADAAKLGFAQVSATPYIANGLEPLNGLRLARDLFGVGPAAVQEQTP